MRASSNADVGLLSKAKTNQKSEDFGNDLFNEILQADETRYDQAADNTLFGLEQEVEYLNGVENAAKLSSNVF